MENSEFNEVALGDTFYFNGTLYRKKSSRTAWLSGSALWFYFGMTERVHIPERF